VQPKRAQIIGDFLLMDREAHSALLTATLKAAANGDRQAAVDLMPQVYEELRILARHRLAKLAPGQTLQPTALVHEAFLRVVGDADPGWDGRAHFFAAAAQAMRNILVDQARRKASIKHGGDKFRVNVDVGDIPIAAPCEDLLALNEALEQLESDDPRMGQIVNMRYFVGMTNQDTAAALGLSEGAVRREWQYIKHWLHMRLRSAP
jgi:RNA polymerase sigma factor (TIGR02999 family)